MTRPSLAAAAVAVLALAVAGCGSSSSPPAAATAAATAKAAAPEVNPAGDIPDNQAYVAYAPRGAGFALKIPEGWSRSVSGHAVTFTDKLNAIRVETTAAAAPPTVAAAKQAATGTLAASVPGYRPGTVSMVSRKAGGAVRTTYGAAARTDPVTGKARRDAVERYVFFHRGRNVVLTLSGPQGADNVDPWKLVTDSVTFTR